jgi:hypothetical protein
MCLMLLSIDRGAPLKAIHQAIISDKETSVCARIEEHHSYTFYMLVGARKASRSLELSLSSLHIKTTNPTLIQPDPTVNRSRHSFRLNASLATYPFKNTMGFFRRAKSFRKKPHGVAHHEQHYKMARMRSHETIGEPLSPMDQFDLEVPSRQPVSILRRMDSEEVMRKRRSMELQNDDNDTRNPRARNPDTTHNRNMPSHDNLDQASTVSSLTYTTMDLSSIAAPKSLGGSSRGSSRRKKQKPAKYQQSKKTWSAGSCCGTNSTAGTAEDSNNSIVTGPYRTKSKNSYLWTLCGPREASSDVILDDLQSTPARMRPPPMRRDTSLFDSLQDEENYQETETTIAVVEMDDDEDTLEQTVVTNGSRWRLRLPKVRSIPKLRSFRRGKRGKKKKKHYEPEDHIGELPNRWMHAEQ